MWAYPKAVVIIQKKNVKSSKIKLLWKMSCLWFSFPSKMMKWYWLVKKIFSTYTLGTALSSHRMVHISLQVSKPTLLRFSSTCSWDEASDFSGEQLLSPKCEPSEILVGKSLWKQSVQSLGTADRMTVFRRSAPIWFVSHGLGCRTISMSIYSRVTKACKTRLGKVRWNPLLRLQGKDARAAQLHLSAECV